MRKDSGFRRALAEKYYSRDGPSDSDYWNIEKTLRYMVSLHLRYGALHLRSEEHYKLK